jgi:hypothetical protein
MNKLNGFDWASIDTLMILVACLLLFHRYDQQIGSWKKLLDPVSYLGCVIKDDDEF